jgi:hypothetical protein
LPNRVDEGLKTMSRTSDLAAAYLAAASGLDQLYVDLCSQNQYGLANQVAQAEADLKQAASSLYGIDAIDQLAAGSPQATAIENLTSQITAKANTIQAAENNVTLIVGLAATLVTVVTDFGAGNIAGGIGAVGQAATTLGQL